jgi:hypothetical protein
MSANAHAMRINAWGLPSTIGAGERFSFKIGATCSAGCGLTGMQLEVFDHAGAQVGAARLTDIWPGTSALYFAEVEAQAPLAIGDYQWQARSPVSESGTPHAAGSCTLLVKVVAAPDHEVTVAAFDSETHTAIEGMHVLLHPYRAFTDASGVARLKVVKGRYRLCVSGLNYIPYESVMDVAADVTVRAELVAEAEGEEDYR